MEADLKQFSSTPRGKEEPIKSNKEQKAGRYGGEI